MALKKPLFDLLSPFAAPARRRRIVRLAAAFALFAAVSLGAPGHGLAQVLTVEASAQAPVQDDLARARGRALSEAMSQALEQAVSQAAPEVRGRLYLVTARARDYVPTYRVISEGEEAGSFRVRIEAQVDTPRLLRDLQGAAPQKRGLAGRRSLQLCARSGAEDPSDLQPALRQAAELLGERGETVEALGPAQCAAGVAGGAGRAKLVLVPGAVQIEALRGTQPRLFGARRTIEWIVERPNGDAELRERAETTAFADTAAAAQLAATQQAALQALRRLLQKPGLLDGAASGVTVSFEGLGSFAAYQQLLRAMGALPGVTRVEPRRFLGAQGAEAEQVAVFVHSTAGSEALGAALGRSLVPGLRLSVMPLPGGDLRVLCVAEGALPSEVPEQQPIAPDGTAPAAPDPASGATPERGTP